jgi:acyl-CoA thioesterase I
VSAPVASCTCLVTRSTAMMGSDMVHEADGLKKSKGCEPTRRRLLKHGLGLSGLVWATTGHTKTEAEKNKSNMKTKILVVGDSLSAEYGLKRGAGWVALLEARLAQNKHPADVVNASISGDTTSGGRSRLPNLLKLHQPNIVILELGTNDALRGLLLDMTRSNLRAMTQAANSAGAKVVLAGMQLPPNYGRQYSAEFSGLFATVAQAENAALVPFFLKGVADGPLAETMFQPDRIHPREEAQPIMLENVWRTLAPLLNEKNQARK